MYRICTDETKRTNTERMGEMDFQKRPILCVRV